MDIQRQKTSVALLSVVSNSTLVALKLIIGIFIGSVSVISEAIHSGVDLVAAIIALFAVRTSGKPADKEHPYGHGKVENISGTVEALLIFLAAGWIIFEAVKKLKHAEPLEDVGWGVAVMLVSSVANMVVSQMLFKVGRKTDSVALQADAWHLRTDVYTSAGVMAGLAVILVGGRLFPGLDLHWVDPVAAIAVALLIIKAAYDLTMESARDLMDISLPEREEQWIRDYIASHTPNVRAYHRLRTRKAGSERFAEFHIRVDRGISVEESHAISHAVKDGLIEQFPGCHVTIHIEPCDQVCTPKCVEHCLLSEEDRQDMRKMAAG